MINKFYVTLICSFILGFSGFTQTTKVSFEVAGKCGMCKERIENALDVKGVKLADWSFETNICKVTYNSSKITEKEIHKILANAGHDTKECRSPDAAYSNLHSCCRYERPDYSK